MLRTDIVEPAASTWQRKSLTPPGLPYDLLLPTSFQRLAGRGFQVPPSAKRKWESGKVRTRSPAHFLTCSPAYERPDEKIWVIVSPYEGRRKRSSPPLVGEGPGVRSRELERVKNFCRYALEMKRQQNLMQRAGSAALL